MTLLQQIGNSLNGFFGGDHFLRTGLQGLHLGGNGIPTRQGGITIGQALQMIHRHMTGHPVFSSVQSVGNTLVPTLTRNSRYQRDISLNTLDATNLIERGLTQLDKGSNGIAHITIAGGLTTPGCTIHHQTAIDNAHDGIVVIHQLRSLNMLQPQTGVGALARSALAQHQICRSLIAHH